MKDIWHIRRRDDYFSIRKLLVECAILTILVGGGDEGVTFALEPFPDTKLVLGRAKQSRFVASMFMTLLDLISFPTGSQQEDKR